MRLTSDAFVHNQNIPAKYTCDANDISPALRWSDVPNGTKSFALICDDPDAPKGTWVHWILYNLPADLNSLPENLQTLPKGAVLGINSWNRQDYGGPCPPSGTHHYHFKLYALNTTLSAQAMDDLTLKNAMQGHILAETDLVGLYQRNH